jgi:NAD(P)-dependent dehydrogenase (short-subunit alcohol dehydrogenase family)
MLGLCGVIPKEYPNVTSFSVDLAAIPAAGPELDELLSHLTNEFKQPRKGNVIAFRGKYRWERSFKPNPLPIAKTGDNDLDALGLRQRGVYLITGGTGGIGLVIAKFLAQTCQARLILTKKSPFMEKSLWRQRLASGDLSETDKRTISSLLEIESLGGEVDVVACEVSDRTAMQRVVEDAKAKFKAINGAIHTAGIVRDGVIQLKEPEVADSVLNPKVKGTMVLYDVLKHVGLDFLVLFSSTSSVTSLHGQSDYSGANAFLDEFSYFANSHAQFRTLSINWPGWREVGILADLKTPIGLEKWKAESLKKAITTKDGIEVFKRALIAKLPQLVVSPEDLNDLLQTAFEPPIEASEPNAAANVKRREQAVDEPQDDLERAVAETWSTVLGFAPIGRKESFLDLGGHSLMAMQIVSRIRGAFGTNFTLRNFFEGPTIAQVAAAIQTQMIAEIDKMDDAEVKRLISEP